MRTARAYLRALGERRLDAKVSYLDLTEEDVVAYLGELREKGLKGTKGLAEDTLKNVAAHVKAISRWLNQGETPRALRRLRIGRKRPRIRAKDDLLTDGELDLLLKAMSPDKRAAFLLLRWSGARPGEILSLRGRDVRLHRENGREYAELAFRETKTDEPRTVPVVEPVALRELKDYLDVARPGPEDYLFPSPQARREGEPLTYEALWRYLRRKAEAVGIRKAVFPYMMRHKRATELYKAPPGVRDKLMGWKSGLMWRNYEHLDTEPVLSYLMETEGPSSAAMSEEEALEVLGQLLVRATEEPSFAEKLRGMLGGEGD